MSISSAFANAASGLTASARAVQVASANIANAMTEGYAARRIDLVPATLAGTGGGVRVAGITRLTDPVLIGLHRDSFASAEADARTSSFWQRVESTVGLPGGGLSQALSDLDSALISASERPDLDQRLARVTTSAKALVAGIGAAGDTVQTLRLEADTAIARDVATLNAGLARVGALNDGIVRLQASGQSTLGLLDERQALVSSLSAIVPLREIPRSDGRVMLFSTGGELLLDLKSAEIRFSATPAVDAGMRNGAGLSPLSIGDRVIDMGSGGPMAGGRLAAGFHIRDVDAPQVQQGLDALAADLINRFADPATDTTLPPGAPGLFTDGGGLVSAVPGLTSRLAVNTAVLTEQGGALWRLRDGIAAAAPGPVGNAVQVGNLLAALDRPVAAATGQPAQGATGRMAALIAEISTSRDVAETGAASTRARHEALGEQVLAQGVDTDAEMQQLLLIEQAYAANARVIETADAMLRRLLEI